MEDKNKEELIKRGFNAAYLIQRYKPALAEKLKAGFKDPDHPYAQGFEAGAFEVEREKDLEKTEAFFSKGNEKEVIDLDRGKER